MIPVAERITIVIDADSGRVVSESRKAGAAIQSLGRTVSSQTRGAHAFNAVVAQQRRNLDDLIRVASRAAIVLGGLFVAGAAKGIQLNAQWEGLEASLTTLLGTADKATRFLERLREVSSESPIRLSEYAEASQLLLGFGVEAQKVLPLLEAVNMAVIATGKGEEEMMRVVLALGQMQSKGKASAEELNQLAEVGIPVNKILQKELGLTGDEVANIGDNGVKAEAALNAIAKGWRENYKQGYEDSRDTFNFQLANLKKDAEQALRLASEPLFEMLRDDVMPRLNEELSVFVGILNRDIPDARKFELIRVEIERLRDELGDLGLDEKLLEAFNDAIPMLAEAAGAGAGKVAVAFAQGFAKSDAWGKLALGALFISKMGLGAAIFGRAGAQASAAFVAGAAGAGGVAGGAGGAAAGAAGGATMAGAAKGLIGSLRTKTLAVAKRVGLIGVGVTLADQVVSEFSRQIDTRGSDLFDSLAARAKGPLSGLRTSGIPLISNLMPDLGDQEARALVTRLQEIADAQEQISSDEVHELSQRLAAIPGVSAGARREFNDFVNAASEGADRTERILQTKLIRDELEHGWSRQWRRMAGISDKQLQRIQDLMEEKPAKGAEALREAMQRGVQSIRKAMKDGEVSAKDGLELIRTLLNRQLQSYGMSHGDAEAILKLKADGPRQKRQRGGFINQGEPSGDSVPSMLERGEYVLNRNAVAAMGGKGALDAVNFGAFARFQRGGYAGVSGDTDFVPALGQALSRMAQASGQSIFVQSGRRTMAEQSALYASYLAGTGNLAAAPNANAPHVRGIAADITPGREAFGGMASRFGLGFTVPSESWHIELLAGGKGAALVGPGGVRIKLPRFQAAAEMFVPAAGGLNNLSAGLEKEMGRRIAEMMPEGTGVSGAAISAGGAGSWQAALRRIAKQRGWSASDWMNLVMKESGGNPAAVNPSSGAFGLGQFLGSTKDAYAKFGAASSDPVRQIEAMARYIQDRYGTPSAALAFHGSNNWYAEGGMVGQAQRQINRRRKRLRKIEGREESLLDEIGDLRLRAQGAAPGKKRDLREQIEELRGKLRGARGRQVTVGSRLEAARQFREAAVEHRSGASRGRMLDAELGPILEGLTGLPYVGAFGRGGKVLRDGIGLLHRNENVQTEAQVAHADRPVQVALTFSDNSGQLVKLIDARVDGRAADVVDHQIGRRSRRIAFAPGG